MGVLWLGASPESVFRLDESSFIIIIFIILPFGFLNVTPSNYVCVNLFIHRVEAISTIMIILMAVPMLHCFLLRVMRRQRLVHPYFSLEALLCFFFFFLCVGMYRGKLMGMATIVIMVRVRERWCGLIGSSCRLTRGPPCTDGLRAFLGGRRTPRCCLPLIDGRLSVLALWSALRFRCFHARAPCRHRPFAFLLLRFSHDSSVRWGSISLTMRMALFHVSLSSFLSLPFSLGRLSRWW